MTQETLNLFTARQELSLAVKRANYLVNQLELEAKDYTGADRELFDARIDLIADLINSICDYDEICQRHIRLKSSHHSEQYLRDQLDVARKYIHKLGGDFNNVLWGKKSDY